MQLKFVKMHGLGNDFAIFDGRSLPVAFSRQQVETLCHRHFGIGCDQLVIIEKSDEADAFMRIYNPDGIEVSSCGNATRCVAWLLMQENDSARAVLQTSAGKLECEAAGERRVCADMGMPRFDWQDIPLASPCDTLHLPIEVPRLSAPVAVSMGNPHMVFVVPDAEMVDVAALGAKLEHHPLFPERANIGFAQALSQDHIRLRVWERGAGETLACGTAACAALVALHRRGMAGTQAQVKLPGGVLDIRWDMKTNHVFMTGEVALVYSGLMDL